MDRAAFRLILLGIFLISATSDVVKKKQNVKIYSFHINSTVTSRYATTVITSRVGNMLAESQEIHFEVKIPKNAFISKFRMIIDGKTYDGVVKEKGEAKQQYTQAVSRRESAGLVRSVGRTLEDFKTSVTIAALSKVTFELTYEELLKRRLGKYELLINAHPMQPVANFKIDVHIHEQPGISFLDVKGDLSTNDLASAISTTRANKDAWVTFHPTQEQQTTCKGCGENGLNGDLLVTYDVERRNPKGEITVSKGYFVHYFAPTDIPRIPKNVVFIIDRSGSMHGRKIEQTRLALLRILSDLQEDDYFGLITFDSEINVWKRELLKATKANLEDAKSFVLKITERGATDINAAVLKGVNMIKQHPREGTASILILLTDGDPTAGETDTEKIMSNVREATVSKFPLYCLGFGYDVNFEFLTQMSLENNGLARRIYEDSDADLQLQGFYDEVAIPLLSDIQLNYIGVTNLTKTNFSIYFNGSEMVVSGQIMDNNVESFTAEVIAISKGNKVTYQETVMKKDLSDVPPENEKFMERLWAYLTVKQLLERQVLLKGQEKEEEKNYTLQLSIYYEFVTPLTSMVVTKPQEQEVEIADKPKERGESSSPGLALLYDVHRRGLHGQRLTAEPDFDADPWPESSFIMPTYISRISKVLSVAQPTLSVPVVHSNRFFLQAVNQSSPICYDVPLSHKLRLLEDTASEFSMNGESKTSRHGFRQIVFHYKTKHHLIINTKSINYHNGQDNVEFLWGKEPTQHETEGLNLVTSYSVNSVSLVVRENEMDVTMGNIGVIILLHKKNGNMFLWPAIFEYPKNVNLTGILGKANISYEELHGSDTPTLKIMDKEVKTSWEDVTDYRFQSVSAKGCWLVPFQTVMQGEISDFTVTQL